MVLTRRVTSLLLLAAAMAGTAFAMPRCLPASHKKANLPVCSSRLNKTFINMFNAAAQGYDCRPNQFNHGEVRIWNANWESAMFTAWLAQIILSEVIGIPTVIETGKRQTCEFYDPQNKFSYATAGYNLPVMYTSRIDKMGKCTCKADQLDASGYCSCANAHTEVWEGQLSNLADGQASNDLTYGGSLGELARNSMYANEILVNAAPEMLNYRGLKNRDKTNQLLKRPVDWKEYCALYSPSNCASDAKASRAPTGTETAYNTGTGGLQDDSSSVYFGGPANYKGHFVADTYGPTTPGFMNKTGCFINYPCSWTTFADQILKWNNLGLRPCGPTKNGGYSYGQLLQVQNAAGEQNEGIITMWWEPDFMHDKWRYTDLKYRLTKVAMPPPNKVCVANRASANDRCSTDVTTRQGTALGNCDHPNEVLFKVFSKQLESNKYAFEFLRNLQLTNSEVGEMLGKWAFDKNLNNGGALGYNNTAARQVVCDWVKANEAKWDKWLPADYPQTLIVDAPAAMIGTLVFVFAAIGVVISILCMGFVAAHGDKKIIRYSQPTFLQLILGGSVVLHAAAVVLALEPSDMNCLMGPWVSMIGFGVFFVPLVVKTWRMSMIFNNKKMKKIRIENSTLMLLMFGWIAVVCVYLAVWTVMSPPKLVTKDIKVGAVVTRHNQCITDPVYASLGLLINFVLLLAGVLYAVKTRNAQFVGVALNESQFIGMIVYNTCIFAIIGVVINYMVPDNASIRVIFQALMLSIITSINVVVLFVPKFTMSDAMVGGTTTGSFSGGVAPDTVAADTVAAE